MTGKKIFIILTALSLTACTMTPEYRRPMAPVPQNWPAGAAYQEIKTDESAPSLAGLSWRVVFTDEGLQKVIELALENNRDLRLAALNVERARAIYGIQRAEQLPSVYAVGIGSHQHVPSDLSLSGKEITSEQYSVSLGLSSWEIDFFGRIRSLKDRALEEYLATDQARRSSQTVLVSAVAIAYLTLAADRENLKLAASTLATQEAAYRLILKRHEVGLVSALDLRRAQSQVETARRDIAVFTQLAAQDENALTLLVGSLLPQSLLPLELYSVSPPQEVSPGLSSEVLLYRPDVLAAEHRLKAANANIGAARAAFFPRISLTTAIGTASADLSGLFQSGSGTWSFIPQITLPVFDARTWSAYEVTKLDREIAVGETYRLSEARYDKGLDSYLGVLDAQRSLYAAQQGLIFLRLAGLINRVTLYKVLDWGE
ncbi:MAG: efflux transporter outer membrane subunit [Deltaproteobacteria bacterium]|nr:efflux transporter outer membrane subunit [Deltaproteobacteria bacterium]